MNTGSAQLKSLFAENFRSMHGSLEEREVLALVAVYESYYNAEGPRCSQVHEVMWNLLLPKLRPELRRWCRHSNAIITPASLSLKESMIRFLGESD